VSRRLHWIILGTALAVGLGIGVVISVVHSSTTPSTAVAETQTQTQGSTNPAVDPGARLNAPAPDFTLTDQFGKRVSLSSLHGKVVVLSFNDPQCTTICPLTTTALLHAKKLLGPAASKVELIGVGANPEATQVKWVRAYSQVHGMVHKWRFLTGSLPELKRVWHDYYIEAAVVNGSVDHTPATYVIGPNGRESRLFETPMAYSSVNQFGYELAQSISSLLPGHPRLRGTVSLAQPQLLGPHERVPVGGWGRTRWLGPGTGPHLILFFDTWESEVMNLRADMESLNGYAKAAAREHLPPLIAIDEANVEASPSALPRFIRGLPHPLAYPVAVDSTGRIADGYRVQDSPWLELVSGKGRFLFYEDLAVKDWPTPRQLVAQVRAAQAK
jgi:cytochrome oxidase Cu insertion factor (SCO1/SenC/PrrC family)